MNNGIAQIFPLTEMQKGMLFHSVMEPNSGIYCEQFIFEITGELDGAQLARSWQSVVDDNDILRVATRFRGLREPVQIVYDRADSPLSTLDLSGRAPDAALAELDAFLTADRRRGFQFERPELIRATLVRRDARSHLFLLTYHHLILDAWSLFLLMKELVEQYDTGRAIGKVRPFYSDYVRSLRLDAPAGSKDFWREYLGGYDAVTRVGDVEPRAALTRNALETHRELVHALPDALSRRLLAASRATGFTLNTLIQGAWGLVLGQASGDDDVVFGITITHRPHEIASIDRMVGIFINSLPKRVRLDGGATARDYLSAVQADQARIKQHEHVPLPDIQTLSMIPGGEPIFETLLIFENFLKSPSWQQARDFSVKYFRYVGWTNYPMAIEAMPPEGDRPLYFQVKFDTNRFSEARVSHLMAQLERGLGDLAGNLDRPLAELVSVRPRARGAAPARAGAAAVPALEDDVHRGLREIWCEVLSVADVDEARTFFEAGGHSLLLFQLQARIQERFGRELDIVDLFDNPTVAHQARLLRTAPAEAA